MYKLIKSFITRMIHKNEAKVISDEAKVISDKIHLLHGDILIKLIKDYGTIQLGQVVVSHSKSFKLRLFYVKHGIPVQFKKEDSYLYYIMKEKYALELNLEAYSWNIEEVSDFIENWTNKIRNMSETETNNTNN